MPIFVRTVDLMKKGLRRLKEVKVNIVLRQNRRPDEEGIKTKEKLSLLSPGRVRTVDLMKKGLRRKTLDMVHLQKVRTVDLMKKGLRPFSVTNKA